MGNDNEKSSKRITAFYKDMVNLSPYLEFKSNREVTLDGCKGILEYRQDAIRINTSKMVVSFKGRGLNIKCLTTTSVIISGYITSVEFLR